MTSNPKNSVWPRLIAIAVYPEHLVVYHAGRGRMLLVTAMKINSIFLCAFSTLAIAPSFYSSPEWPNWTIPAGEMMIAVLSLQD